MTARNDQRWRTAIHEAAHCVAAHELGAPVFGARIAIRRGEAKIATVDQILAAWQRCGDYRAGDVRAAARVKIQICQAGPCGDSIAGHAYDGGSDGDARMVEIFRRQFCVTDTRLKRLERRTRSLLRQHWGNVTKLATWLNDAGSLTGAEIAAILKRA